MRRLYKFKNLNPLGDNENGCLIKEDKYLENSLFLFSGCIFAVSFNSKDPYPKAIAVVNEDTGEKEVFVDKYAVSMSGSLHRQVLQQYGNMKINPANAIELITKFGEYVKEDSEEEQHQKSSLFLKQYGKEKNSNDDNQGIPRVSEDCLQQESEILV